MQWMAENRRAVWRAVRWSGTAVVATMAVGFAPASLLSTASAQATPTAAGEWHDFAGGFTKADRDYDVDICSDDGFNHFGLEEIGVGYVWEAWIDPFMAEDASSLSQLSSENCYHGSVDGTTFSEGAHLFRGVVNPGATDELGTEPWWVYVDRTAPSTAGDFQRRLNTSTGQGVIEWSGIADPHLSDDSAGSGVALVEARYSINGGSYSAWTAASNNTLTLTGRSAGDVVGMQVRATDTAGNVSSTGSATLTLQATDTTPPSMSLDVPNTLHGTDAFTVNAADSQTGISSLTIEAVEAPTWSGYYNVNYGCSTTCSASVSQPRAVGDFFDLEAQTIRVTAHDGAGNIRTQDFPLDDGIKEAPNASTAGASCSSTVHCYSKYDFGPGSNGGPGFGFHGGRVTVRSNCLSVASLDDFVTNEMWLGFGLNWTEAGQAAGFPSTNPAPYFYWADQRPGPVYSEHMQSGSRPAMGHYYTYEIRKDGDHWKVTTPAGTGNSGSDNTQPGTPDTLAAGMETLSPLSGVKSVGSVSSLKWRNLSDDLINQWHTATVYPALEVDTGLSAQPVVPNSWLRFKSGSGC